VCGAIQTSVHHAFLPIREINYLRAVTDVSDRPVELGCPGIVRLLVSKPCWLGFLIFYNKF